ncbi:MAG: methionine/alanine import family NSS transporter small subunit [Nocardioides sp.]|nr:methionine/alanine import family NSS transporter small subunit [Nocardioides sp.]
MTTSAILMMIFAMLVIWGGLVLAMINLSRSPHQGDDS